MEEIKSTIRELHTKNIIIFGDFTLTSGLRSPYYIDLRKIYSHPGLLKNIIKLYIKKLSEVNEYNVISGIESGSIALAALIGYELHKPFIYVRKEPKKVGTMKLIEGDLKPGDRVVIVDDVATTGGNILHAAEAIRASGGLVQYAVVFIDRLQGASKRLLENGIRLQSILNISYVIDVLYREGYIDSELYETLRNYIDSDDV